jgi:hypothetical protein
VKSVKNFADLHFMMTWRAAISPDPDAQGKERRRHGRLAAEGADSSLGMVKDLSGSGMRVLRKGAAPVKEGETFRLDLQLVQEVMQVTVVVRRISRIGRRKYEYGVEFVDMTDAERQRLARLARIAACQSQALL